MRAVSSCWRGTVNYRALSAQRRSAYRLGATHDDAWWVDPFGAICIGLLILFSWVSQAFEQVWLLVGKGAPREFLSKVIYLVITHDDRIAKVDTVCL